MPPGREGAGELSPRPQELGRRTGLPGARQETPGYQQSHMWARGLVPGKELCAARPVQRLEYGLAEVGGRLTGRGWRAEVSQHHRPWVIHGVTAGMCLLQCF